MRTTAIELSGAWAMGVVTAAMFAPPAARQPSRVYPMRRRHPNEAPDDTPPDVTPGEELFICLEMEVYENLAAYVASLIERATPPEDEP